MNADQVEATLRRYKELGGNYLSFCMAGAVSESMECITGESVTARGDDDLEIDWGHEIAVVTVKWSEFETTHVIPFDSIKRIEITRPRR